VAPGRTLDAGAAGSLFVTARSGVEAMCFSQRSARIADIPPGVIDLAQSELGADLG
jgi:hypothetical protein